MAKLTKCTRGKKSKVDFVDVNYSDGTKISTSMNPDLKDSEIKDYFKVGRAFNVGSGPLDKIATVKTVKIHRKCK